MNAFSFTNKNAKSKTKCVERITWLDHSCMRVKINPERELRKDHRSYFLIVSGCSGPFIRKAICSLKTWRENILCALK